MTKGRESQDHSDTCVCVGCEIMSAAVSLLDTEPVLDHAAAAVASMVALRRAGGAGERHEFEERVLACVDAAIARGALAREERWATFARALLCVPASPLTVMQAHAQTMEVLKRAQARRKADNERRGALG